MAYVHDTDDLTAEATSNSSPYAISGSSFWGPLNDYWHAFNHLAGASAAAWVTASGQITNQYITLDFGSGVSHAFTRITVTSSSYDTTSAPKNMIIRGSNNGSTWDDVYTVPQQTGWSADETRSFSFTNTTAYRYFRLFITDYNGFATYGSIGEIEIFVAKTLLTFQSKQIAQSTTEVNTTSTSYVNDTQASINLTLSASSTVLVMYVANNLRTTTNDIDGMWNAIKVNATDYAQSKQVGAYSGNTCFWIGTLGSGSHTIDGRIKSHDGGAVRVNERILIVYVFNGDAYNWLESATEVSTTSTTFVNDTQATFTSTPSGSCKVLVLYNNMNLDVTNNDRRASAIDFAGADYNEVQHFVAGVTGYNCSEFTMYAASRTAISTTINGRIRSWAGSYYGYSSRRQFGYLCFADNTTLDTVSNATAITTTTAYPVEDSYVSVSLTPASNKEWLCIANKTALNPTSSTALQDGYYGIKLGTTIKSRGFRSIDTGGYPTQISSIWAETLSSGSYTLKAVYGPHDGGNTADIDARYVVSLQFTPSVTPVNKTIDGRYDIYILASDTMDSRYDLRQLATDTVDGRYDLFQLASDTLTAIYDITELYVAAKIITGQYDLRQLAGDELAPMYDIFKLVSKNPDFRYDIFNFINKNIDVRYDISQLGTKTVDGRYDIRQLGTKTLDGRYYILNFTNKNQTLQYDIFQKATKTPTFKYDVFGIAYSTFGYGLQTAGNFCIGYNFLDYTATASSSDPNYPVINLKDYYHPRKKWKGTQTNGEYLILDFGSTKQIPYVMLNNSNFSYVRIEGHPTNDWLNPQFVISRQMATDERVNRIKSIFELSGFEHRYMRIYCYSYGTVGDNQELGNIIIPQNVLTFYQNPDFGYKYASREFIKQSDFETGGIERVTLSPVRKFEGSFGFDVYPKANEGDHFTLANLTHSVPVVFWENLDDAVQSGNKAYLAYLSKDAEITWDKPQYIQSHEYLIEEII